MQAMGGTLQPPQQHQQVTAQQETCNTLPGGARKAMQQLYVHQHSLQLLSTESTEVVAN